jgi:hypothetical protein
MNREQFFGKLAGFDEDRLKKALWNLYWRGAAPIRERIEAEVDPTERERRERQVKEPPVPRWVLGEVQSFAALARSGAYIGGDRRVTPRERTRWRFTFQRLAIDAQGALLADVDTAATAVEALIDLACDMHGDDYFRSDDPIEAARFVVSDAVAVLWGRLRDRHGFAGFAERAAPQFIRWEREFGWTRSGWGRVSETETSLAAVLARMLRAIDMWVGFTDRYLDALDELARTDAAHPKRHTWRSPDQVRQERARNLAEWHLQLVDRLAFSEAEDRLDRLVTHPALGGPELTFVHAQLAHRRGDVGLAHELVQESLHQLPGHRGFLAFASEISASLPPQARRGNDGPMLVVGMG